MLPNTGYILLFVIMTHRFKHLESSGFLDRRQAYPAIKKFLHIRRKFHHLCLSKKLGQRYAETFTDRLKGSYRRNGIPSENVSNR